MTRRLSDLYELLAADAKLTEPTPPAKRVPSYLRQYITPVLAERKDAPRTHADPTARKAISNAEPQRPPRRLVNTPERKPAEAAGSQTPPTHRGTND